VFLILIPLYHSLVFSEFFLFLRQTTSQMDVPARDSFTNTIIPGEYRIKANSVFNSVRTGFQIPGPLISSILIDAFPATVFYSAGSIKMIYDVLFFRKYKGFKDS
ncbi:MAG: MFS transporter, partial [Thermoplasmataceae archaeon]